MDKNETLLIEDYLRLGLRLGRHLEGLVDAYYGPARIRDEIEAESLVPLRELSHQAHRLIAQLDGSADQFGSQRRAWLRAQCVGLDTTARVLEGDSIAYLAEVEQCYGVQPDQVQAEEFAEAHRQLDASIPGHGDLAERMLLERRRHTIDADRVPEVVDAVSEYLRAETQLRFGLPEGEEVEYLLESDKPYSGFNYYDGELKSRVAINTDLPLLSPSVPHLIAHESYPGHHTEHCAKEVGLVRQRHHLEETIFLVGTPSCVIAEGLADTALEALITDRPHAPFAPIMEALGVHYDLDVVEAFAGFAELSTRYRGQMAIDLHDRRISAEQVGANAQKYLLVDADRASKMLQFLSHPTWRAYVFCYSEGYRLCSRFARRHDDGFSRLLHEQLTPADL